MLLCDRENLPTKFCSSCRNLDEVVVDGGCGRGCVQRQSVRGIDGSFKPGEGASQSVVDGAAQSPKSVAQGVLDFAEGCERRLAVFNVRLSRRVLVHRDGRRILGAVDRLKTPNTGIGIGSGPRRKDEDDRSAQYGADA